MFKKYDISVMSRDVQTVWYKGFRWAGMSKHYDMRVIGEQNVKEVWYEGYKSRNVQTVWYKGYMSRNVQTVWYKGYMSRNVQTLWYEGYRWAKCQSSMIWGLYEQEGPNSII